MDLAFKLAITRQRFAPRIQLSNPVQRDGRQPDGDPEPADGI
jgi:hypothetical protein